MLSDQTVPIAEIAEALGKSERTIKQTWRKLHSKYGFPPPLPGGMWVWSRDAVESWIFMMGTVKQKKKPKNDNLPDIDIEDIIKGQNAFLRRRIQEE